MNQVLATTALAGGYTDVNIIHDINLHVNPEEIVTIAGTNGAGKSTFLKALLGLLPRTEGTVHLYGQDISGLSTESRIELGLAYVPQVTNVFRSLTVMENLQVADRKVSRHQIDEMLAVFPALGTRLSQRAGTLSGGERQQLAFARALIRAPKIIVLDEPTAALAPGLVQSIFDVIGKLKALKVAVLMVEQRARQALEISDRGYILDQGKVVLSGNARELLDNPEMTELYLGTQAHT
ncbi:ABC transporter ATP-binding protein [Pusillimonas sp. MFBS29]|uniref:ABC transporter ATP-binding protein n=1 Tax=Pusillimonas sp. MFBS29 TaxID=2886690 RepID=UPI001D11C11D|nr:ABC transporter ATP-binding protein [Pusillimonas sp. MFBS29]MCC2596314.1 ABC transporter ATP-binding protein [Pusillimonas sp. MFBS29]